MNEKRCTYNENTDPNMQRIVAIPVKSVDYEKDKKEKVVRYIKKKMEREYILRKCKKRDEGGVYFLCNHHEMETVTKKHKIMRYGKEVVITHTFQAPSGKGLLAESEDRSTSNKIGKSGTSREYQRNINNISKDISHLSTDSNNENNQLRGAVNDNANLAMNALDMVDTLREKNESLEDENEKLKRLIKKYESGELAPALPTNSDKHASYTKSVVITYDEMDKDDSEIKRRTGFTSLKHLLAYVITICNGDHDTMIEKTTTLTWLEEWIFFFEYLWGRTLTRWWDAKAAMKTSKKAVIKIFCSKLKIANRARDSWPRYASFEEDFALMKDKWKKEYKDVRIVMWDDTNVNLTYKPSAADDQRLTYSQYYAGNCAKGGVFLQLCGWTGVEHLWVGATSDTHYQEHTQIFEKQRDFAAKDLVNGKVIPFTNMVNKGYRINLPAWRAGQQLVYQPIFAKSDRKFTGRETIKSAKIATHCSGNERAVNRCKMSGYIKRGLQPHGKTYTLDDAWLAWSFQTNFMHKAVL